MAFESIKSILPSPPPRNLDIKINSREDLKKQRHINKMLNMPVSLPGAYKMNKNVSRPAKDTWMTLNQLSNIDRRSWWTQEKMAELTGQSARTIRRHIKELVEVGWLRKGKKRNSRVNVYTLENPAGYIDPRERSAKNKSIMMDRNR